MLIKAANYVLTFPSLRQAFNRWRYNKFSKTDMGRPWNFMNYGYAWPASEKPPVLDPGDEPDRLCIQLYHRLASEVDVKGKTVLEVGCGRGGGAAYIAKYLGPKSMTGVDLSKHAIAHCQRAYTAPNLTFQVGDGQRLPFADQTFDVVLNVESSHCYPSAAAFFREAARVLKDGGTFFWQDLKAPNDDDPRLSNTAKNQVPSNLTLVREADITAPVQEAMEKLSDDRKRVFLAVFPRFLHAAAFEQWGIKGSQHFDEFVNGKIIYVSRTYIKRG